MCSPEAPDLRYDLQPQGAFVALERDGLRIALHKHGRRTRFVPYAALTHCEVWTRPVMPVGDAGTETRAESLQRMMRG